MDIHKDYFVTYGYIPEGSHTYSLNSIVFHTLYTDTYKLSPGKLALYLEEEVSKFIDCPSLVILNYWEM